MIRQLEAYPIFIRPRPEHRTALALALGLVVTAHPHLDGTVSYHIAGRDEIGAATLAWILEVDWLELAPTPGGWRVTVPVEPTRGLSILATLIRPEIGERWLAALDAAERDGRAKPVVIDMEVK